MDAQVRQEAAGHLQALFQGLGHARQEQDPSALGSIGGMVQQVEEFMEMPMELANIFINMSTQLVELVLTSLEEAGFALVKGMTPL